MTIGITGLVFGAICIGLAVMILKSPYQQPAISEVTAQVREQCDSALKIMGMVSAHDVRSGVLTASMFGTDSFEGKLARASFVIAQCGNYKLEQFCMGQNCPGQDGQLITGVSMQLQTALTFSH